MRSTKLGWAVAPVAVGLLLSPAWGAVDCSWSPSSTTLTAESHAFDDIAAGSATSAWAVGTEYEYDIAHQEAVIQEWDGLEWSDVSPPAVAVDHSLHSVARIPGTSDEAWAVGGKRVNNNDEKPIIFRRTSEGWELSEAPNVPGRLLGVDARSSTDAWAVGYDDENRRSLIVHWDGDGWKRVPAPSPGNTTQLEAVDALGANHAWAVGIAVTSNPAGGKLRETLALRWNGAEWKRVSTPNVGTISNHLDDVNRIPGTSKLWAVGYRHDDRPDQQPSDYKTLAMRWNGTSWRVFSTPSIGKRSQLHSATAISGKDVWAFGVSTPNNKLKPLFLQWDGSTWVKQPGPVDTSSGGWLVGSTSVPSSDRIWTAGFHFPPGADDTQTYILHGCEPS